MAVTHATLRVPYRQNRDDCVAWNRRAPVDATDLRCVSEHLDRTGQFLRACTASV